MLAKLLTPRVVGICVLAQGVLLLLTSLLLAWWTDPWDLDYFSLILIGSGLAVSLGYRPAIYWSLALMGFYLLLSAGLLILGAFNSVNLRPTEATVPGLDLPFGVVGLAFLAAASAVNLVLLVLCLRQSVSGQAAGSQASRS